MSASSQVAPELLPPCGSPNYSEITSSVLLVLPCHSEKTLSVTNMVLGVALQVERLEIFYDPTPFLDDLSKGGKCPFMSSKA